MPFAIMRCKKLKTVASVAASLSHCFRDRDTLNADSSRSALNVNYAAGSASEAMQKLISLLPEKRRKDAVLAVEYMMTASPEWWRLASHKQQLEFFQKSYGWLAQKYGEDRIFVATVHKDETTPHLSAFVVPLTRDGRLSAKEFIGDRGQMSSDQSAYASAVKELGLERGVMGSKAKHQSIKAFYAALERGSNDVPKLTPDDVQPRSRRKWLVFASKETSEAVAERLNAKLADAIAPIAKIAAMARLDRSRANEMHETALLQSKQLAPLRRAVKGLGREAIQAIVQHIELLQSQRREGQERSAPKGQNGRDFER